MPVQVSEELIIKECKKNKREGYNMLFKKYEGYIYTICFHYTNSQQDALDLLQEVFIRIYQGMVRFETGKPILPWIKKITVNTCLNYLRSRKAVTVSLDEVRAENNKIEDTVAAAVDVENTVIAAQAQNVLNMAIAALPPQFRLAIILRHIDGMSYQEIGQTMSVPIGTVKTYLYRGRNMLKAKLKQSDIGESY